MYKQTGNENLSIEVLVDFNRCFYLRNFIYIFIFVQINIRIWFGLSVAERKVDDLYFKKIYSLL